MLRSGSALLFSLLLLAPAASAEELALGASIPEVTVADHTGASVELAKEGGEGWTLVYFYPKADTPGCTKQACSLRDSWSTLTEKGVRVFGVSTDDPEAQDAFRQKFNLPFTLLADEEKAVVEAFGVPTRMGFASRQAYLFKDGKLVWRDLKAATEEQAADVLAAIEEKGEAPSTQPAS